MARPAPVQRAVDGAGAGEAAGFAETVLGVWLESGTAVESSPEMARLRLLAPGVQAPRWGRRPVAVLQVAAVRTERQGRGTWAVTVAARLTNAAAGVPGEQSVHGLRFFTIPVTETGSAARRVFAAGAPREAAGPQAGREPASPCTARVEDPALIDTVRGFLSAFLGGGTVERYLVPGTVLARPQARFPEVETLQVLSGGRPAGAGRDGATPPVSVPWSPPRTRPAARGRWRTRSCSLPATAAGRSPPSTPTPTPTPAPVRRPLPVPDLPPPTLCFSRGVRHEHHVRRPGRPDQGHR
ncbi:hypothetical protein GCM10010222_12130 [Streptomyces tanashiensis]|nr:hypothetical protein GCM10010222_12130 [Streptomyces tanashiensis]